MGLDMYLHAKRYLWSFSDESEDKTIANEVQKLAKIPEDFEVKEIVIKAGYWRKANQIHRWFVENVQDGVDNCGDYYVERNQLQELLDLCKIVRADHSQAEELLPSASGFFFGNTDYDEWYYNDIENTISVLEDALEDKNGEYYYTSSW